MIMSGCKTTTVCTVLERRPKSQMRLILFSAGNDLLRAGRSPVPGGEQAKKRLTCGCMNYTSVGNIILILRPERREYIVPFSRAAAKACSRETGQD